MAKHTSQLVTTVTTCCSSMFLYFDNMNVDVNAAWGPSVGNLPSSV